MPNPHAGVSEIIGLLEAVNDFDGNVNASVLADDFDLEIDEIYPAIESAEMLGLISTPEGDVRLTDTGRAFLKADIQNRKDILREQMLKVESFSKLIEKLRKSSDHRMKRTEVMKYISDTMKSMHPDLLFTTLTNWARYAELLRFDADEDEVYLVV